jgi:hypothetical protein
MSGLTVNSKKLVVFGVSLSVEIILKRALYFWWPNEENQDPSSHNFGQLQEHRIRTLVSPSQGLGFESYHYHWPQV